MNNLIKGVFLVAAIGLVLGAALQVSESYHHSYYELPGSLISSAAANEQFGASCYYLDSTNPPPCDPNYTKTPVCPCLWEAELGGWTCQSSSSQGHYPCEVDDWLTGTPKPCGQIPPGYSFSKDDDVNCNQAEYTYRRCIPGGNSCHDAEGRKIPEMCILGFPGYNCNYEEITIYWESC